MYESDTIAAISTPLGEGGIGIVKISGSKSKTIINEIFKSSSGQKTTFDIPRKLYHGFIIDSEGLEVDEVLATYMPAPYTYTKEDVVEVNCHSGIFALRSVLELVLGNGARLAEPGEFTKRAFLNGRIDLSQAEAVLNIIKARSEEAVKIAAKVMKGELSKRIEKIRSQIIEIRAPIEAMIDYPEEYDDILPDVQVIINKVNELSEEIDDLLKGVENSRALQEGVSVAILGKPNVGKSSLLNSLLRQQKAIVHETPGTTRDILEGFMSMGGYPIRLLDTAGIEGTSNPVEMEGINRSRTAAAEASLIIYVIDGSAEWKEDEEIASMVKQSSGLVVAINKQDLLQRMEEEKIKRKYPKASIVKTSALKGIGIQSVEQAVSDQLDMILGKKSESSIIVSIRHEQLLKEVKLTIEGIKNILGNQPWEIISSELQHTWNLLGNILGLSFDDSLLDKIFNEFCLGK